MFIVMAVKQKLAVDIVGTTVIAPLSFADGMIGALPVFETYEQAHKWAGDGLQIVEVKYATN
jgi:hypothetical protein